MRTDPGDAAYGIPEKRADWPEVVTLCTEALGGKTKDLYLACCLLEGLVHTEGPRGIADGLWLIAELHEQFWADFFPRPRDEGTNLDARLNQLEALIESLGEERGRILNAIPMNEGDPVLTRLDWKYAGEKFPGGDPSPWSAEQKEGAFHATSWDSYSGAVESLRGAQRELDRIDNLVDQRYPAGSAPSLLDAKEGIAAVLDQFEGLLREKGPSPHEEQARGILEQTGCTFVDTDWLAERASGGESMPRMLNSIQAAVVDDAAGLRPEEGWQALLAACWDRDESYEQRSEGVPEAPAEAAAPVAPVAAAPAAVPVSGDAVGTALGACRALRAADPGHPLPYVATRLVRWWELDAMDTSAGPPAPRAGRREQFAALFASEKWLDLLELCETTLEAGEGAAWLDLQRYGCAAMGQIGAPYGPARTEIIRSLGAFLRGHAWLVEANLADGDPSADDITRNWIAVDVGTGGDTRAAGPTEPSGAELEKATQLLENEGLEQAILHLREAADGAPYAREKAVLLQDLGELCLRAERPELAAPVLERLREELRRRGLAEWEGPEFIGRALEALYRSYTLIEQNSPSEDVARCKRAVADELAQVDLSRRLRLDDSTA